MITTRRSALLASLMMAILGCGAEISVASPDADASDAGALGDATVDAAMDASRDMASDAAFDAAGDATVHDGGATDTGLNADAGPPPRIIFASSGTYTGDFGGLSGADAECARLASNAPLSGSFRAWMSTDLEAAGSRLSRDGRPVVLSNGTRVADDFADLVDGTLSARIDRDERGNAVAGDVWTGTLADGTVAGTHCDRWRSGSTGTGRCGSTAATNLRWSDNLSPGCGARLRIYCIEE